MIRNIADVRRRGNELQRRRSGFVLLTVLMLVAFGAVLLSRYSLQSLKMAADARRVSRSVAERWALWSATQVGLAHAERLLAAEQSDERRMSALTLEIPVAGQTIVLRIVDLDCAVNVNSVAREAGISGVRRVIAGNFNPFDTIPLNAPAGGQPKFVFSNLGQLVRINSSEDSATTASKLQELHEHATCWGSGQLNVRRCSDDALARLGDAIGRRGLMSSIIRERAKNPKATLEELVAKTARGKGDAEMLRGLIRDTSTSWSVFATTKDGQGHVLLIREQGFGQYSDRTTVLALQ